LTEHLTPLPIVCWNINGQVILKAPGCLELDVRFTCKSTAGKLKQFESVDFHPTSWISKIISGKQIAFYA
jgi:hypothetical protein